MKFIKAENSIYEKIKIEFGKEKADFLHFNNGFTYMALDKERVVGFVSTNIKNLPYIIEQATESYIDVIEVKKKYRRQGIATRLLNFTEKESKKFGAYQLRAWSSEDKKEAIMMWRNLGFCLHPQKIISQATKKPVNGYFVTKKV